MAIQFWLTYNNGKEKLRLPVNPSSMAITSPFQYEDINVSQLGERTLIGDKALKDFTFSSFFPKYYSPAYCEYTSIPKPWDAIARLERWRDSRQPIRLIVTGTPINYAVTIRDFSYEAEKFGADGDIYFSITLKQFEFVKIRTISTNKKNKTATIKKGSSQRPNTKSTPKTHTVVKGDTLWAIAKKYYGDSGKWKIIYEANKKLIGKNPNAVQIKQVLVIP